MATIRGRVWREERVGREAARGTIILCCRCGRPWGNIAHFNITQGLQQIASTLGKAGWFGLVFMYLIKANCVLIYQRIHESSIMI